MSEKQGPDSNGGRSGTTGSDEADSERPSGTAMGDQLPAPLRLRSAGTGVVGAGLALAGLSVVLAYATVAGLLVGIAAAGALTFRDDIVLLQLCLGVGMVGAVGLTEALTDGGLGLGPTELAGLAVVFGLVDIVLGAVVNRLRSDE